MAVDCMSFPTSGGILIGGPVQATKNQSVLAGHIRVFLRAIPQADRKIWEYSLNTNINARFTCQFVNGNGGLLRVGGRALEADPQRFIDAVTPITAGIWWDVVALIDFANSTGAIFLNGVQDVNGALSGAFGAAATDNTPSQNGALGSRSNATQVIDGFIEDFRLYNRIISPNEALTLATSLGKDGIYSGIQHYFPLNDGVPGTSVVTTANLSNAERIVGTPIGTPAFAPGISVARQRQQFPVGRRG